MNRKSAWSEKRMVISLRVILIGVLLQVGLPFIPMASSQDKIRRKDIPSAPLPEAVDHARKVFLSNGQTTAQYLTKNGNVLAFDSFYADMKSWGKYELVGSPKEADIVIELQWRPYSSGSSSFGVYNPTTHTVQSRTAEQVGGDFALVIYEAKSKEQLWTASDACGVARLVKNQQKEVIKSIARLVGGLKTETKPSR